MWISCNFKFFNGPFNPPYQLGYFPNGGEDRTRTYNLMLPKQCVFLLYVHFFECVDLLYDYSLQHFFNVCQLIFISFYDFLSFSSEVSSFSSIFISLKNFSSILWDNLLSFFTLITRYLSIISFNSFLSVVLPLLMPSR